MLDRAPDDEAIFGAILAVSGCEDTCFSALAWCACLADSTTPLILAGPPFIFVMAGEVGVFGDDFAMVGDVGSCLVAILTGRDFVACAVLEGCG